MQYIYNRAEASSQMGLIQGTRSPYQIPLKGMTLLMNIIGFPQLDFKIIIQTKEINKKLYAMKMFLKHMQD